ncbi:MAG: NAD(P)H-hydrate dehydratase [Treponema sp.]|nr:NAD(P)H-hydrate dehydratase [Treponema sp.]
MQYIFNDTKKLDSACCVSYALTEEIMMENAAMNLERIIRNRHEYKPNIDERKRRVLILCGKGNNGADGYALSRRIRIDFDVIVFQCGEPESELCKIQAERAIKCGTRIFDMKDFSLEFLQFAGIVVDCIYGSGFHGELSSKIQCITNDVNDMDCFRISCDIPSGIDSSGNVSKGTFIADVTVTMGALKMALFSDKAKDFTGKIVCGDLGVGRRLFENASANVFPAATLLEESDLILPERKFHNVNKGSFGHAVIASGEKRGAGIISAKAAFKFGAGLVSLTDLNSSDDLKAAALSFPELIISTEIPQKTTAVAFGMGLGEDENIQPYFDYLTEHTDIPCVVDADACMCENLPDFLSKRKGKTVLTPHPKEFKELLRNCSFGEVSLSDCVLDRPRLIEEFCRKFPKIVLLVKGANTMIGCFDSHKFKLFVNANGTPALAKGGSGDVLSGMICALLSQRYSALDAATNASLAHALASRQVEKSYALTPLQLIDLI